MAKIYIPKPLRTLRAFVARTREAREEVEAPRPEGRRWSWARYRSKRRRRYTTVGITFHWTMAALIFFQIWWGWRTSRLPVGYDKLDAYQLHAEVGAVIFFLALARFAWRMVIPRPINTEDIPGWQHVAAQAIHWAFYGLMVLLPLTGWLMLAGAFSQVPTVAPWGLAWPAPPAMPIVQRTGVETLAGGVHVVLAWSMAVLIVMHVGAALKHHFINEDEVLHRMAPVVEPRSSVQSTD